MKKAVLLFLCFLSFSAMANVAPLYKVDNADRYEIESIAYEYNELYQGLIFTLETKFKVPGHPELNQDIYIARSSVLSFENGEFVAKIAGQEAVCAVLDNGSVVETGACEILTKVQNNVIVFSLSIID